MSQEEHLSRLNFIWEKQPVYFITTCVAERKALLATETALRILRAEWAGLRQRHGWAVGRYVLMPDHVHFFVAPSRAEAKPLSYAVGKWKEWTAKRLLKEIGGVAPLWQPEFFDHVLRSYESRSEKWEYVRENPIRGGLVTRAEDWPFAGAVDFE